jgi:hypothetical protein
MIWIIFGFGKRDGFETHTRKNTRCQAGNNTAALFKAEFRLTLKVQTAVYSGENYLAATTCLRWQSRQQPIAPPNLTAEEFCPLKTK